MLSMTIKLHNSIKIHTSYKSSVSPLTRWALRTGVHIINPMTFIKRNEFIFTWCSTNQRYQQLKKPRCSHLLSNLWQCFESHSPKMSSGFTSDNSDTCKYVYESPGAAISFFFSVNGTCLCYFVSFWFWGTLLYTLNEKNLKIKGLFIGKLKIAIDRTSF